MNKYTKLDLYKMTSTEMNKALEKLTGVYSEDCNNKYIPTVSYCTDYEATMKLAFKHKISLIDFDGGYTAYQNFSIYEDLNYIITHDMYYGDPNPLQAVVGCLILILQEKQGN